MQEAALKSWEEENDAFFDDLLNDVAPSPKEEKPPALVQAPKLVAAPEKEAPAPKAAEVTVSPSPVAKASASSSPTEEPKKDSSPAASTKAAPVAVQSKAPTQPPADANSQMRAKMEARKAALEGSGKTEDAEFDQLEKSLGAGNSREAPKAAPEKNPSTVADTRQTPKAPAEAAPKPAPVEAKPSSTVSAPKAVQAEAKSASAASAPKAVQANSSSTAPTAAVEAPVVKAPLVASAKPVQAPPAAKSQPKAPSPKAKPAAVMFSMDDGEDSPTKEVIESSEAVPTADLRPPEAPEPLADFSAEDLALRKVLIEFYMFHNASNVVNVNNIVKKYRGLGVSHLWASLGIKYSLPPFAVVDLLARTIYFSVPFEHADEQRQGELDGVLKEIRSSCTSPDQSSMLRKAIEHGAQSGSDAVLRLLCFRGVPDESKLRPQVWKTMLGYLPMARHSEWNAIQGQKRALYASYKSELLVVSESFEVSVKEDGVRPSDLPEAQDLLASIRQDIDRTRRDFEYFRKPSTRGTLIAMLFIYARLNPGVKYVQGMNEVAAIILHVLASAEVDAIALEADCFWCFSEMMVEIKENFMEALDHTAGGINALINGVQDLMKNYDPDLARHLQQMDLPPFLWAFRWCTLLFAQDATLPDAVRLWDSFIADPRRFEFVVYVCLALVLEHREELLKSTSQFALTEALQAAPRQTDSELLIRRAMAICAFERREQTPPFPLKPTLVIEDFNEMMQSAAITAQEVAGKAQEVGAEVSRNIQENIAPVVIEQATKASTAAALAASEGAQKMQVWLEETAPARKEALEKASSTFSSMWSSVRASAAAASAVAVEKGQRLAAEYGQKETVDNAATRLNSASTSASSGLSSFYEKATSAAQQLGRAPVDSTSGNTTASAVTKNPSDTTSAPSLVPEAETSAPSLVPESKDLGSDVLVDPADY